MLTQANSLQTMEPEALVTLRAFAFCPSIIHPTSLFCQGVAWKWLVCEKVVISVSTRYEGLFFLLLCHFSPKIKRKAAAPGSYVLIPQELQRKAQLRSLSRQQSTPETQA